MDIKALTKSRDTLIKDNQERKDVIRALISKNIALNYNYRLALVDQGAFHLSRIPKETGNLYLYFEYYDKDIKSTKTPYCGKWRGTATDIAILMDLNEKIVFTRTEISHINRMISLKERGLDRR